jgi:hypothetical protein
MEGSRRPRKIYPSAVRKAPWNIHRQEEPTEESHTSLNGSTVNQLV